MTYTDKTLAQIVTEFPVSAALFEKHDLDYCCKGKQTLKEACHDSAKVEFIEKELAELLNGNDARSTKTDFSKMDAAQLVEHILAKHHHYVKESMPVIQSHLLKIAGKHGVRHPELNKILMLFSKVEAELSAHMMKEEKILFPAIVQFYHREERDSIEIGADQLSSPMQVMEMEHETVGNLLEEIRNLSNRYIPPSDACLTYRLSFEELKSFEEDLHQHVHLENNILFPMVRNEFKQGKVIS